MILPDVNLLVYAYNSESDKNSAAIEWWESTLSGTTTVGLSWAVLLGFLRLITNPRACKEPLAVQTAIEVVESWLAQPTVQIVQPGRRHAELVFGLLREIGTGGNLTSDAHLAAIAIEYQAVVHTTDADFSRFSGLRWINPLAA